MSIRFGFRCHVNMGLSYLVQCESNVCSLHCSFRAYYRNYYIQYSIDQIDGYMICLCAPKDMAFIQVEKCSQCYVRHCQYQDSKKKIVKY